MPLDLAALNLDCQQSCCDCSFNFFIPLCSLSSSQLTFFNLVERVVQVLIKELAAQRLSLAAAFC